MTRKGDSRFAGAIAAVTGAAQGIGRATALRFAREGARVVVADRAQGPLDAVAKEARELGAEVLPVVTDLERREGAVALVAAAEKAFGRLDILVNNVGGTIWMKPFWEYPAEQVEREIQRSLWPTLWCCHAALPGMVARRKGSIVNVGSVATRGIYRVPYAAAKGGVQAITTTLGLELATFGVRVNSVAPGGIDVGPRPTPRNPDALSEQEKVWLQAVMDTTLRDTPMGRMGTPDEMAAVICFLASDDASYVTGQTIYAAGGGIG